MPTLPKPLLILAMPDVIVIPGWDETFENANSRKLVNCRFFCVPNHFDGKKIRRLQSLGQKAVEYYGAFHAICAIASKCAPRGTLIDKDGPINVLDLSAKTGFDSKILQKAIEKLAKPGIGLIEIQKATWNKGKWEILPPAGRICHDLPASGRISQQVGDRGRAEHEIPKVGNTRENPPASATISQQVADSATICQQVGESASRWEKVARREGKGMEGNPPTVPQGDRKGMIEFDEAKQLFNKLFGREKRHWSFEEDELLSQICPIARDLWPMIDAWFRLPLDHPVFAPGVTKRKQELTTYLRDFNGENDKMRRHASLFMVPRNGSEEKKEPAGWREIYVREYGEIELPASFWEMTKSMRGELPVLLEKHKEAQTI